jgi:hypothetical protein
MSSFGLQIRIKLVIWISVHWSVNYWVAVLRHVVRSFVTKCQTMKEVAMKLLYAMVITGVTLLPV